MCRSVLMACVVALVAVPALGEDGLFQAEPGYEACAGEVLFPVEQFVGGLAYAPDGSLLVYVDAELVRWSPDGDRSALTVFNPPVLGSFLTVGPTGDTVFLGDSSAGNIYAVPLDGSRRSLVDHVAFNYALVFDDQGRGYVSTGANERQEIVLFDSDPELAPRPIVVNIPGFSGPVAVDDAGSLYYGTADFFASSQVLQRFSRGQLDAAVSGDPIDFTDGEEVAGGFGGFNQMVFHDGALIYTDLGFTTGAGRVERLDLAGGLEIEPLLVTSHPDGVVSATYVALAPGDAPFIAGAGAYGGQLSVIYSDFVSVQGLTKVRPQLFFVRGELNQDGTFDLSDVLTFLNFFFLGGPEPHPLEAADMNGDGTLDVTDPVFGLSHLFLTGPPLPAPFPERGPAP